MEEVFSEHDLTTNLCFIPQVCTREFSGEKFNAKVHIDSINKRLIVGDYTGTDWEEASRGLLNIARNNDLGKVLFFVRVSECPGLEKYGFVVEGRFPRYYRGEEAICYSYFTDTRRGQSKYLEQEQALLNNILQIQPELPQKLPLEYVLRPVRENEAEKLVQLYKGIFNTYPSPLMEVDYVRQVMTSHVKFFGVFIKDRLISAASAEKNDNRAEITDCATLKDFRGKGLLTHLLKDLEEEMRAMDLDVLFSLARAGSFGMNAVLHRIGYHYHGRFINNCHIGGRYEDMNLWIKELNPVS